MIRRFFLYFVLFFSFNFSFAQDGPSPRSSGHLFYFKPTQSLILIDGYSKGTTPPKMDIWSWKNNKWSQTGATDQPLRSLSAAAYMSDKEQLFLFGGISSKGYEDSLKDSYVYDGRQWISIADNSIGTRDHHEMVYDEQNKCIIVYGGQNAKREFDTKTWIFKNDHWTSLNIPSPGTRYHHAMAYDVERKKTVLFGGYDGKSGSDDTWEFDGEHWEKMNSATGPSGRGHHSMVYDPSRKKILMYGGDDDSGAKGDVWAWDGKNWEQLSGNGPARVLPQIAFNPENNKLYVFGGSGGDHGTIIYSDLWTWDGKTWTRINKGKTYKWDMQKDMFVISNEE